MQSEGCVSQSIRMPLNHIWGSLFLPILISHLLDTLLLYLLAASGILFIIFHMIKFLLDLRNSRSKVNADIDAMRADLKESVSHLAPWSPQELELLSTHHTNRKRSKAIDLSLTGDITNIYQESVISYRYKDYFSPGRKAILVARTSTDEYIYKVEKDFIYLFINEEKVGYFDKLNNLYKMSKRKIAQMELSAGMELLPITMNEATIASFNNKPTGDDVNNRAVQIYNNQGSSTGETLIITSFAIKELVMNEVE